jgi:cobalt/nickel transport system permease protein
VDIRNKLNAIYSLEQLSAGNTVIHRIHPMCKLIAAFVFIITVLSFGRHDLGRLIPFIFYPVILMSLSETPYVLLLKRVLIAIPFCLFVGISNVALEQGTAFSLGSINVSFGVLSFCVILYRACLCVMAVVLLAAVTPFAELTAQLRRLKIPDIFILVFEMTYRYIGVLFTEAASMRMAYFLRGAGSGGVDIRHAGNFIGCLLLRSFDRAERIYSAMNCRGYMMREMNPEKKKICIKDLMYCASICSLCLLFRFIDTGAWLAAIAGRVL